MIAQAVPALCLFRIVLILTSLQADGKILVGSQDVVL